MAARSTLGAVIAAGLLQAAIWMVGDTDRTEALLGWQIRMGQVVGISLLIAVSYTLWPKLEPKRPQPAARESLTQVRRP